MKNTIKSLKIITLAIALSFGLSYVYAWTAPTSIPPAGNVSAPINTSTTSQVKGSAGVGGLGIEGLLRGYSNAIFDGNVGIGTTIPQSRLHVLVKPADTFQGIIVDRQNDSYNVSYQLWRNGIIRWALAETGAEVGSDTGSDLSFVPYNDSGVGISGGLTIKRQTGNVGIGTTVPATRLDVAGAIRPIAATVGSVCSPIGSQAYNNATGAPLYCNGTVWAAVGAIPPSLAISQTYNLSSNNYGIMAIFTIGAGASTLTSCDMVNSNNITYIGVLSQQGRVCTVTTGNISGAPINAIAYRSVQGGITYTW